jgi:hypothetical protein
VRNTRSDIVLNNFFVSLFSSLQVSARAPIGKKAKVKRMRLEARDWSLPSLKSLPPSLRIETLDFRLLSIWNSELCMRSFVIPSGN